MERVKLNTSRQVIGQALILAFIMTTISLFAALIVAAAFRLAGYAMPFSGWQ